MSLKPHYCDLVLLDKPWSSLGFLTSLFIHQTDQSFNFDLREEEGISYWLSLNTSRPAYLLWHCLQMHDAGETRAHNWLEVQHHHLGIEDFPSSDGVGQTAHDKAGREFVVWDTLHLGFDIFSRGDGSYLDVIRPNLLNLDLPLWWIRLVSNILSGQTLRSYFVGHDQ